MVLKCVLSRIKDHKINTYNVRKSNLIHDKLFVTYVIFMLSTFVLSVTICILIVIAILWFNAQPCPNEDLESKQNGSGQKEVISRKEISKAF